MKSLAFLLIASCISILTVAQQNFGYETPEGWKHMKVPHTYTSKDVQWQFEYDLYFAKIDVEVYDTSNYISGNVAYHAVCTTDPILYFKFQLVAEMIIDSVLVDGVNSTFSRMGELVTIELPAVINTGQDFVFQVFYRGQPDNPVNYRGLFSIYDDAYGKNVTYTLSEPFHLKEWLPCKEELHDKIDSVWTFITTDTSCLAGSCGLLEQVTPLGNGKHRFEWKTRYPMAYYLISLNVADYLEYNIYAHVPGIPDSILVQNYIYDTTLAMQNLKSDIDKTPDMMNLYSRLYGNYPFYEEKYGHCQVKLPGAMEHQTMTTLGVHWDWVIAHELAHMWFGDYVTCATWQDIWVNEGWATFSEYLFFEDLNDVARMTNWTNQTFFHAKQQPLGSVYVPFEEAGDESRIFSYDLSYKKGGAIVTMMRYLINNDSLFFSGCREFISNYANSNATGDQLRLVMESVTGIDLQDYFNEWYFGQGYPIFDIQWNNIEGSPNLININLAVTGSSLATNFFSLPVPLQLHLSNGNDTMVYITPLAATGLYPIETGNALCQSVQFDPYNNIVDSLRSMIQVSPDIQHEAPLKVYYSDNEEVLNIVVMHSWLLPMEITVVSANGKTLMKKSITENHTRINLSQLPPAVYSASISNQEIHFNRKFVKTR